jgi:hypothetical protein
MRTSLGLRYLRCMRLGLSGSSGDLPESGKDLPGRTGARVGSRYGNDAAAGPLDLGIARTIQDQAAPEMGNGAMTAICAFGTGS